MIDTSEVFELRLVVNKRLANAHSLMLCPDMSGLESCVSSAYPIYHYIQVSGYTKERYQEVAGKKN